MREPISFTLNGGSVRLEADGDRMLLWVLRTDLGLTGAKYGCGEGLCGACTVLVDGEPVRSCQVPVKNIKGKEVVTIEGLAEKGRLHPVQEAFIEHEALQCGFCTPGMILTACAMLRKNPRPAPADVVRELDGNLCRCGAHKRILEAVQTAATRQAKGGVTR